jgi:type 1 glutamine amidotransferase
MSLPVSRVWVAVLVCGFVLSGGAAERTVLFLIGEHEYGTRESLPAFARLALEPKGLRCEFVFAKSDDRASVDCHVFPGLTDALGRADLLFLSVRRRYPVSEDLEAIRGWIRSGRPVVAIRTSSHAFGERPKGEGYQAPKGHAAWNTLDRDLLGVSYTGHYNAREGHDCVVRVDPAAAESPLLSGLDFPDKPLIFSHLYKSEVIDPAVRVLLRASIAEDNADEPVAWTVTRGGQKTFYTSVGGPEDMKLPWFSRLLVNAVEWALEKPAESCPPSGAWLLTVKDPDGRAHHPRVVLTGEGQRVAATYRAASDGKEYVARQVRLANDRLSFTVKGPNWTVRYHGRIDGDSLAGRLEYDLNGTVGSTEFAGFREK